MTTKELYTIAEHLCEAILFNWEPEAAAALARESLVKLKEQPADAMFSEREEAVRAIIKNRVDIIDYIIKKADKMLNKQYYVGKKDGLLQVYELLGESLESIRIELE